MQIYHNSQDKNFRCPTGAVVIGEKVRLSLLVRETPMPVSARIRLWNGGEHFENMTLEKSDSEGFWYSADITVLSEPGLLWYSFEINFENETVYYTNNAQKLGGVGEIHYAQPDISYQITVYDKSFKTPDWFKNAIMYQIFPDRFCRAGEEDSFPERRCGYRLHEDWYEDFYFDKHPFEYGPACNDFYGGNLKGIMSKLDYLKELGISVIYLNPIFEAHSNHRYNTANYLKIDPVLGDEKDLENLVKSAKKQGIEIILDGVFSHTGDDSIYFNKYGRYDTVGAYNSKNSPYFSWFKFSEYPNEYSSWWGISTLPETEENDLSFTNFIAGENGVIKYWLDKGVKGFRLDVADELPDGILDKIRLAVKRDSKENYLLGEVWEDASTKISYGSRRRFLRGKQLDSVMNYPFANAIIDFVKNGKGQNLVNTVMSILENYPKPAVKLLMNHIGTHDTSRILTVLGSGYTPESREEQSRTHLYEEDYKKAVDRLKLAAVLQYTLPGVPSLFYGDEAGVEGYGDPFCRATYPWGRENMELLDFYKHLGKFRRNNSAFKEGEFVPIFADDTMVAYIRTDGKNTVLTAVNVGVTTVQIEVPKEYGGKGYVVYPNSYILESI